MSQKFGQATLAVVASVNNDSKVVLQQGYSGFVLSHDGERDRFIIQNDQEDLLTFKHGDVYTKSHASVGKRSGPVRARANSLNFASAVVVQSGASGQASLQIRAPSQALASLQLQEGVHAFTLTVSSLSGRPELVIRDTNDLLRLFSGGISTRSNLTIGIPDYNGDKAMVISSRGSSARLVVKTNLANTATLTASSASSKASINLDVGSADKFVLQYTTPLVAGVRRVLTVQSSSVHNASVDLFSIDSVGNTFVTGDLTVAAVQSNSLMTVSSADTNAILRVQSNAALASIIASSGANGASKLQLTQGVNSVFVQTKRAVNDSLHISGETSDHVRLQKASGNMYVYSNLTVGDSDLSNRYSDSTGSRTLLINSAIDSTLNIEAGATSSATVRTGPGGNAMIILSEDNNDFNVGYQTSTGKFVIGNTGMSTTHSPSLPQGFRLFMPI